MPLPAQEEALENSDDFPINFDYVFNFVFMTILRDSSFKNEFKTAAKQEHVE